jgi:hypothetical protein
MGEQRARDAEFFYRLNELRELTGYVPKRLNEIAKRYKNRRSPDGKRKRVFYLADEQICNDEFSGWLLEGRFRGSLVPERPNGTVTLKQAEQQGVSYHSLQRRIHAGELEAYVSRGRYYVERVAVQALGERFAPAPANWLPVVCLTTLAGRARQSVYAWVKRQSEIRTFFHPTRAQPAQHLPVRDAIAYLSQALGSAHLAIKMLSRHAPRYFRSLTKTRLENLFGVGKHPELLELEKLKFTSLTEEAQLLLNAPRLGHELLSIRT